LQPRAKTVKSGVLGSNWVLVKPSYPKDTQRLEKNKFPWPEDESEARELVIEQLQMLLVGIDFFAAHKELFYKTVA